MSADDHPAGLTVRDMARLFRVSPGKVRTWIARGELSAINTADALCGRPRYVVLPDAMADFEKRRAASPPPKSTRRRKRTNFVDFFPD